MDKENLKELKQRFNELFKAGDLAAACEVAEEIMRAFPESASGYYYALVAETKNFRVRGDEKKTEELYARFCERAEKPLADKYGEKLAALLRQMECFYEKSVQPISLNSMIFFSRSSRVTSNLCARQSMQRNCVAPRLMSFLVSPTSLWVSSRPQDMHFSI